jgi:hypothetical protein
VVIDAEDEEHEYPNVGQNVFMKYRVTTTTMITTTTTPAMMRPDLSFGGIDGTELITLL